MGTALAFFLFYEGSYLFFAYNYYITNKENVDWICRHLVGCDMKKVVRVTLTGLDDSHIRKYLKRNLKLKKDKVERCICLVHSSRSILSKPVFLDFLEMLPENIHYCNSYKIYEEIVKAWMQREKDKSVLSTNPLGKVDLGRLFDQMTERYFSYLFSGHIKNYFQLEEFFDPKPGIDIPNLGSRALLRYDSKKLVSRQNESSRQAGPVSQNQICQSKQHIQFGSLLLQASVPLAVSPPAYVHDPGIPLPL